MISTRLSESLLSFSEVMHIGAVHVFHDEIVATSNANVHRRNDVGVVQFGGAFLLLESFDVVLVGFEAAERILITDVA